MSDAKVKKQPTVTKICQAGPDHQVLTVEGGKGSYRREPCGDCPWRKDATGVFPAEAFRHSASTAYDMATHTFACHQSGQKRPATCAGFLLRGAEHNLTVRLGRMKGQLHDDVADGGHELHESYRAMAVANGVDPKDSVLAQCRDGDFDHRMNVKISKQKAKKMHPIEVLKQKKRELAK